MQRPFVITFIGLLFITAGAAGIYYHHSELSQITEKPELLGLFAIRLLAIVGGVFVLRGAHWARWLLIVWMTYHTVLSIFHTPFELVIHILFLAIAIYALFNKMASGFFRKQ